MEVIEIDGNAYQVRQTDSAGKKWVQTENGERIAIKKDGTWMWKSDVEKIIRIPGI